MQLTFCHHSRVKLQPGLALALNNNFLMLNYMLWVSLLATAPLTRVLEGDLVEDVDVDIYLDTEVAGPLRG